MKIETIERTYLRRAMKIEFSRVIKCSTCPTSRQIIARRRTTQRFRRTSHGIGDTRRQPRRSTVRRTIQHLSNIRRVTCFVVGGQRSRTAHGGSAQGGEGDLVHAVARGTDHCAVFQRLFTTTIHRAARPLVVVVVRVVVVVVGERQRV